MGEVPPLPAYEVLPFAPGEGPFRVKGIAYRGHCEYVERFLAGGLGAQQAAIVDERLRGFLGQTFLASSWYDVYPLVAAGSACARVAGRTLPDFLRARARFQAEQDLQGVYRAALTVASPALLAEKLPPMFQRYFDFGHAVVHEIAPNAREAHVEIIPVDRGISVRALPGFEAWVAPAGRAAEERHSVADRGRIVPPNGWMVFFEDPALPQRVAVLGRPA